MLSIITIGRDSEYDVQQTIDSIANNIKKVRGFDIELILVLRNINPDKLLIPLNFKVKKILNEDKSIYHAMNIGWDAASGNHLWFLNSGDTAVYAESFISKLVKFPKSAHVFSVRLIGEVYNFKSNPYNKKLHSGFIFPNCDLRYDESGRLDADSLVISKVLKSFDVQFHSDIIANFLLDGVSNQISLEKIPLRFERGFWATISLFLKWSFYSILPRKIFWRIWALKNSHKRLP